MNKKQMITLISKIILFPLSVLVCLIAHIRQILYTVKFLKKLHSNIPIISVGNIQMGGTGKTPFVVALCENLIDKNINPVIITRGYKRNTKDQIIFKNISEYNVQDVGDEPYLQKLKLPNVRIIIDYNKRRAVEKANTLDSVDCIILDDGFQSMYLKKQIEIVLISNWYKEKTLKVFPLGNLRESLSSLKRADYIYTTKGKNNYKLFDNYKSKALKIEYKIITPNGNRLDSNSVLQKKDYNKIYALCGIANPEHFFEILHNIDLRCDKYIKLPNHFNSNYHLSTLEDNNSILYITTYKDYFKLDLKKSPVLILDMYVNINDKNLINNILGMIQNGK